LDPEGYELPPAGKRWCARCRIWESRREREERHGTSKSFQVKGVATSLRDWSAETSARDELLRDSIE